MESERETKGLTNMYLLHEQFTHTVITIIEKKERQLKKRRSTDYLTAWELIQLTQHRQHVETNA